MKRVRQGLLGLLSAFVLLVFLHYSASAQDFSGYDTKHFSGVNRGVWEEGGSFQIESTRPAYDVIMDFGAAYGTWVRYDDGSWDMLHGLNPEIVTVGDVDGSGDDDLIIDFHAPNNNSLNGIWIRYDDGSWYHIHGLNAEAIAVGDVDSNGIDDLIIDFGAA